MLKKSKTSPISPLSRNDTLVGVCFFTSHSDLVETAMRSSASFKQGKEAGRNWKFKSG
jgi:hypothetical protein